MKEIKFTIDEIDVLFFAMDGKDKIIKKLNDYIEMCDLCLDFSSDMKKRSIEQHEIAKKIIEKLKFL